MKGIYDNETRALARREDISPLEAFLVLRFKGRISTIRDPDLLLQQPKILVRK